MVIKTSDESYAIDNNQESKSVTQRAVPQVLAVTVKNILLVAFGLIIGFPTILIPGLSEPGEKFNVGTEGLSWIGSIQLICVPIGCILSGTISQAIGRRRAMQMVNVPFMAAWLIFYFSTSEWQIFLALALSGLTGGFLEAPVLTYVAEISEAFLRGMLSTTSSMSVILGVMIMFIFGSFLHWRTVALVSCAFNVASFLLLFFIPESPHWLISKNRLLDARKSLSWLRGWTSLEQIEPEYKQVYRDVFKKAEGEDNPQSNDKSKCLGRIKPFFRKNFLWPYSLVIFIFFLNHFTGITTLQTYAVQIFATFHSPLDKYYCTMILGIMELIGTILSVWLVHFLGKRVLNFISLIGNGVAFVVVASYAYHMKIEYLHFPDSMNVTTVPDIHEKLAGGNLPWIPFIALIMVALTVHVGVRVVPWVLVGEVFSNETRAAGAGICSATTYIFSFIINKIFYHLVEMLTLPGLFWAFSMISFLGCAVLYFVQPETEGYTLGEIQEHFSGGKELGNRVYKSPRQTKVLKVQGSVNNGFMSDEQYKFESRL